MCLNYRYLFPELIFVGIQIPTESAIVLSLKSFKLLLFVNTDLMLTFWNTLANLCFLHRIAFSFLKISKIAFLYGNEHTETTKYNDTFSMDITVVTFHRNMFL